MKIFDFYPSEHELFKKISQNFPFRRKLTLDSYAEQDDEQYFSTFITFPHLEHLDVTFAHADYGE